MGLPEGMELTASMLNGILSYILDLKDSEPAPEVESARRTPRPLLDPGQPPRPYIVHMLRPDDKKRIIQSVSKKKQLSWKGKPFWVQQDFPREIREKRKEYNNIRKALKMEKSVRYGILPPARLIVTIQGETSIYKNAVEAAEDLKKKLPKTFEDWPQA